MANQDVIVCHRYESRVIVSVTLNCMFLIWPSSVTVEQHLTDRMTSAEQQAAESASRFDQLCTALACLTLPDVATSIHFLPKLVAF